MTLKDQVAVITGGGSGIGRAIARAFAKHQACPVILDRNCDNARAVAAEIQQEGGHAQTVCADVSLPAQVEAAFDEIREREGKVDILVNCAGVFVGKDAVTLEGAEWDRCFEINLKGAWTCSKYAIPLMIAAGGGSIVNIGSTHSVRTQGKAFPYGVTKAGLAALTRSLAVDFGRHGIRANVICPGLVVTPLTLSIYSGERSPTLDQLIARQPLPVQIQPDDIASAAVFLASEMARCITGTEIFVDGGRTVSAGIDNPD